MAKKRSGGCSKDTLSQIISPAFFLVKIYNLAHIARTLSTTHSSTLSQTVFCTVASSLSEDFKEHVACLKDLNCYGVTLQQQQKLDWGKKGIYFIMPSQFYQPQYLFFESNCCPHTLPLALAKNKKKKRQH